MHFCDSNCSDNALHNMYLKQTSSTDLSVMLHGILVQFPNPYNTRSKYPNIFFSELKYYMICNTLAFFNTRDIPEMF